MAKVCKVQYTGSAVISITDSMYHTTKVPMPPEGRVTKLYVRQTTGTPAAFTADLLDSLVTVLGDDNTTLPGNLELYRILPQQTAIAGATIAVYEIPEGFAYRNQDGTQTLPVRAIYLLINPAISSGTTVFEAAVTVQTGYATESR